VVELKRRPSDFPSKEYRMTRLEHTPEYALLEEAITVLFCLIDDIYRDLTTHKEGVTKP
jgi:hypothetical protein